MTAEVRSGDSTTRTVAMALAVISVATFVALLVFFVAGGPWGTVNDVGNLLIGVASVSLALGLHPRVGSVAAVVVAAGGAAVIGWGSWLVMSGQTGFVLAGLVASIGLGMIGVWLAAVAWSGMAGEWPRAPRTLARAAAVLMIAGGAFAVPGALMGIDDYEAMPGWLWAFSLAWIGAYLLYPAWAWWLSRRVDPAG